MSQQKFIYCIPHCGTGVVQVPSAWHSVVLSSQLGRLKPLGQDCRVAIDRKLIPLRSVKLPLSSSVQLGAEKAQSSKGFCFTFVECFGQLLSKRRKNKIPFKQGSSWIQARGSLNLGSGQRWATLGGGGGEFCDFVPKIAILVHFQNRQVVFPTAPAIYR